MGIEEEEVFIVLVRRRIYTILVCFLVTVYFCFQVCMLIEENDTMPALWLWSFLNTNLHKDFAVIIYYTRGDGPWVGMAAHGKELRHVFCNRPVHCLGRYAEVHTVIVFSLIPHRRKSFVRNWSSVDSVNIIKFWEVAVSRAIEIYRPLGGMCCLQLYSRRWRQHVPPRGL